MDLTYEVRAGSIKHAVGAVQKANIHNSKITAQHIQGYNLQQLSVYNQEMFMKHRLKDCATCITANQETATA